MVVTNHPSNQFLTCRKCGTSNAPIDGNVFVFGRSRFPVFSAMCKSCGEIACLDCAPSRSVPDQFLKLIDTRPTGAQFHAFQCPHCKSAFPSDDLPARLFVYENYLRYIDLDSIRSFGGSPNLIMLYGFDISYVQGLPAEQRSILSDDGLAALITVGVPGVIPMRCSKER